MARGIQLAFTLNPRDFLRGLRRIELDLDDVKDALDDVEDAGDDAFDVDTSDAQREMGDLERDVEGLEDAFVGLSQKARREIGEIEDKADAADITPDVRSGAKSARTAAGALAGEVFDEFVESWGEAVRSGDYGDAIRETFSNLGQIGGTVFGPVGAVGGAVAGFLLTGIYDRLTDSESKERIATLSASLFDAAASAEDAYQNGFEAATALREGFVAASQQDQTLVDALGVDTVQEAWAKVAELTEASGLPISTVVSAINGEQSALENVQTAIQNNEGAYQAVLDDAQALGLEGAAGLAYEQEKKDALDSQHSSLNTILNYGEDTAVANNDAADALEASARFAASESAERQDSARASRQVADNTAETRDNVRDTPDIDIKAKVDTTEIDNLPTSRTLNVGVKATSENPLTTRLINKGLL